MTEAQIKHMVDRFLAWKLPANFNPDDGISFEPIAGKNGPHPFRREPQGTNLFGADQADAMVRHMLAGLPRADVFVCSSPRCDAVWAEDPKGHCPKCLQPNGVGYSTMRRTITDLPSA